MMSIYWERYSERVPERINHLNHLHKKLYTPLKKGPALHKSKALKAQLAAADADTACFVSE